MHQIWGLHFAEEAGETGNVIFLLGQSDTSVSNCNDSLFTTLIENSLRLPSYHGYGSTPTSPEQIMVLPLEYSRGRR